jgi:lipoate-protein ligase A
MLLQKIVELAVLKGYNAVIEKNDLLIEGYKTASYSYRPVLGGTYVAMHLSMSVNIDLIKNVCKKPMVKVPKGLNDFDIVEEDILKIIEDLNEEIV